MSSNEQKPNLGDAKNLHKTSVSNEVVIRFSHVTKTYNLYKNDKARFLGIFNYQKKGMFLGSVNASDDLSNQKRRSGGFSGPQWRRQKHGAENGYGCYPPYQGHGGSKGSCKRTAGTYRWF